MAEFKLGRIKFVYQGTWTPNTSYLVDDVVTNGGKTYICVLANTSSSLFITDLNAAPTCWNLVSDGTQWTGSWTNSHYYNLGDLVLYGNTVYQCTTPHTSASSTATIAATAASASSGTATLTFNSYIVQPYLVGATITVSGFTPSNFNGTFTVTACTTTSVSYALTGTLSASALGTVAGTGQLGLEINSSYWTLFASSLNWSNAWAANTRYKQYDLVYYGGNSYVCNTAHVSAATAALGLENNSGLWDTFNSGINYLGVWSGSSVRYKANDIVKFGADLWICTTPHTSTGSSLDASKFNIFVNGVEFGGSWNNTTQYVQGDVVTYGGYTYTAIQTNTGQIPSTATSYWQIFTTGLVFSGDWVSSTNYQIGDVVRLGGYTYVATSDNNNQTPPNVTYWARLNSGVHWNATNATYTAVSGTNITGTGTGAKFNVTTNNTAYTVTINPSNTGTGFAVNNTIKILGTAVGGLSPANDIIVTVTGTTSTAITTVSATGYSVTWVSGTVYVQGDAVYFGVSTYICTNAHVAASGNRPDNDTTASYWNILASGADSGALTTQGDMVFYGSAGPQRLPIGTDGQVLRVNNNVPSWSYYGILNNVVFVAPSGTDSIGNGQGLSLDKPWASLLFACRQIEEGYLNTNAGTLLQINKQFMMKEVNNYLLYTYSFAITSASSTVFTCSSTAKMNVGMPITFTTTIGGVTVGQIYYVKTIANSTTFSIATTYGGSAIALTPGTGANTANFSYVQSKAERDTGFVLDAVIFDLTHSGNYKTTTATQAYFNTLTSFITTNTGYEVTQFIAALAYLENRLLPAILSNTSPTNNYQTLNGVQSSAQVDQIINTNYTTESGALAIAQNLIGIVTGALSAGTYANIPALVRPHTSIYLKTGTYNEYTPIVVPLDTAILGDELRSTIVQAAVARPNLVNDRPKTIASQTRMQALIPAIMTNIPVTASTGNSISQSYLGTPVYSTATQSIITNTSTIQTILAGGLSAIPGAGSTVLPTTALAAVTNSSTTGITFTTTTTALPAGTPITITGTGAGNLTIGGTALAAGQVYYVSSTPSPTATVVALSSSYANAIAGTSLTIGGTTTTGFTFTYGVLVPNTGTYTLTTPTGFGSTLTNTAYAVSGNATGTTTSYDLAVANVRANITFIQAEIAAYMNSAYNSVWTGMTSANQGYTLRDVAYLLNSIIYDTTYGGNTQCQIDGLAYYSLGTANIISGFQAATTGMITRIQTIIPYIVNGNTAGWTKTSGNNATQTVVTSGTYTNAANYVVALVTGVLNWVNGTNGTGGSLSSNPSGTVQPCSGWVNAQNLTAFNNIQGKRTYIQAYIMNWVSTTYPNLNISTSLTYRDAGTIIDALSYDMLLGSTYYSLVAGRAYYRLVTSAQTLVGGPELGATEQAINYISYLCAAHAVQATGPTPLTGDLGSVNSTLSVINNTAIIQNMLTNGIIQEPSFVMSSLTGYNTAWLIGYGYGVVQIQNNYQFIKDEITNYLNDNLSNPAWSAYSTTYQAETIRDLSNILDAICYDMTYGCNDQSLIAGRAYYSLNSPLITSTYLPGVTAALTRLNTIISQIILTTTVSRSVGNTTTQSTSATAGSAAAAAFAQARIADIVYWINNGYQNTTGGTVTGTISGTTLSITSGSGLAIGQCITGSTLTTTVTGTTASTNVVTLVSTTGLASGMAITFSTPFGYGTQAPFGGLTTTTYTINTVVGNTITLYNFGTTTSPILTTATGSMTANAGIAPGTYITAGSASTWTVSQSQTIATSTTITSTFTITPVVSGAFALASNHKQTAFNAVQARATEIQNDAQAWVTKFYQAQSGINLSLTNRDAGYIVTALSYDLLLDSNFYSIINGRAYNRLIPLVTPLTTTFYNATYGAIGFIGQKIKAIAASGGVIQAQTTIDDVITNINGQPTTTAVFNGSINGTLLTVNSVTSGTVAIGMQLSGAGITSGTQIISGSGTSWLLNYSQNVSSLTTIATTVTTGSNYVTLGNTTGIVPGLQITFSGVSFGGLTAGTYYVVGVANSTQITISTSFGGSVYSFASTATGAMTAVVYGIYGGLGLTTNITGTSTIIPVTAVTTSTNLITVSSTAGMSVNMPVVFSSLPSNVTTTATATTGSTTNTITLSATVSSLGIVAGQQVYFTGVTFGTVVFNQIYYVVNPTGSSIQISNTLGGSAISLTTATGTMNVIVNAAGGLVNGNLYWINSIASGTTLTITSNYKSNTAFAITNSLTGLTSGITAGLPNPQGLTNQQVTGTLTYNNSYTTQQGAELLRANTNFLANEAAAYVATVFGGIVINTTVTTNVITTSSAHNLVVGDPVQFTATTVTTNITATSTSGQITVVTTNGMVAGMPFSVASNIGGISTGVTYYVLSVINSTTLTISATSNGIPLTLTTASGLVAATVGGLFGGLTASTEYYVLSVPSTTTLTISTVQSGTGTQTPVTLTTASGVAQVSYYYIFSKAVRDATLFVNALIYDLNWTGNYKSLRYAQVYLSAQSGATATDMFHVRNGTGIRNMTLNGLSGSLAVPNSFGTRRPTAGAYVSLDPGFGPNDSGSWANVRSCYVQNVTNFGSGCVGLKIDAALHGGGNRSILANDFTQVLSDGIGVWCTGSNSLTECVSVFSYYGYTGYLAELGGRIRATNGNSSYGTYGVIAEGIDSFETPVYATLNNRYNPAYITNVVTDGLNQILRIEYENAGSGYTNNVPTINGSGYNATATGDELRDSAVFETILVDLNNGQGVGGSNYLTNSNTAQTGSLGQITIANTDTQLSTAYVGMRIQLTAGTGVGQYGNILSYNNGTKVALVYRPTFVPLIITASSTTVFTVASTATLYTNMPIYIGANVSGLTSGTLYYVSATNFTSTQFSVSTSVSGGVQTLTAVSATPAVMATSTIVGTTLNVGTLNSGTITVGQILTGTGVSANTYIIANLSGSGSGSTWTVSVSQSVASTTITGTISVPVYAAGWDHVIPGATTTNTIDLTSAYIIEPAITYTSPGFTSTAKTLSATATWGGVTYGQGTFVAVAAGATSTSYSTDGKTWTAGGALPSSTTWNNVVYGGGQGATATAIVGGLGGSGAVLTAVMGTGILSGQVLSVTIVNGGYNYTTPPTIVFTPISGGSGATATCTVLNGSIASVTVTIGGSNYSSGVTITAITSEITGITANTWGKNYFTSPTVTISPPVTSTAWTSGGSASIGTYYSYSVTVGSTTTTNYYLATSTGTFASGSGNGPVFTSGSSTNGTVSLTYSGTLAVATPTLTNYGVSGYTVTQPGYGYTTTPTVTVTDPNAAFVAISSGSSASAYQLVTSLGSAWSTTNTTLPTGTYYSLAYGNNIFVAVGGNGSTTPYGASLTGNPSTNGWTTRTLTGSVTYSSVTFGNGIFLAVPASGQTTTISANAVSWSAGGNLPVSTSWVGVAYGNGRFVALAANGTVAYSYNNNANTPGATWTQASGAGLGSITTWKNISYGQGLFFAIATGTTTCATSWDGINWTLQTMSASTNWQGIAFGNPINTTLGSVPTWVAVSNSSGTIASYIQTGATPLGRMKVTAQAISEIRMIEPGSGFPRGNVTATTVTTNLITVDSTVNLVANQPIVFNGTSTGGITTGTYYYVVSGSITSTQFQVSLVAGGTAISLSTSTISGMTYFASPITAQVDPNRVNTAPVTPRIGNGALGNPTFGNRGTANATATASIAGDGYADIYQTGTYVNVSNLYRIPTAGANVVFSTITGSTSWYKLVSVTNILGIPGNYTATFQINPGLNALLSPPHGTLITTNLNYSQVRLTGHDFLYIGTGNQTSTNYPNVDATKAIQANQELQTGGGRVFFTSTDQDGNFNVGNLFGVQQSTGTASLNASAFNLAGLQSLTLGAVSIGVGSATITQFSTDPYFTANSDNIVPTQKAIKAFITSQIGGGTSSLNVNTITAGQIYISGNTIQTTTGGLIYVSSKMYFTGGVDGAPVALAFFGQR
jgi:hypothetical protein